MTASPSKVPEQKSFKWGADMKNLGIAVGIATVLWFIPPPSGVTAQAWHLLAVFIGTIVGIITKPLPLGAVAMLGLGASMLTKTLTFAQAFSAFASEIPCAPRASSAREPHPSDTSHVAFMPGLMNRLRVMQVVDCNCLLAVGRLHQVWAGQPHRVQHCFAVWEDHARSDLQPSLCGGPARPRDPVGGSSRWRHLLPPC